MLVRFVERERCCSLIVWWIQPNFFSVCSFIHPRIRWRSRKWPIELTIPKRLRLQSPLVDAFCFSCHGNIFLFPHKMVMESSRRILGLRPKMDLGFIAYGRFCFPHGYLHGKGKQMKGFVINSSMGEDTKVTKQHILLRIKVLHPWSLTLVHLKNFPLEKEIPFWKPSFSGSMLNFGEGNIYHIPTYYLSLIYIGAFLNLGGTSAKTCSSLLAPFQGTRKKLSSMDSPWEKGKYFFFWTTQHTHTCLYYIHFFP